jgi:hypothetical protein
MDKSTRNGLLLLGAIVTSVPAIIGLGTTMKRDRASIEASQECYNRLSNNIDEVVEFRPYARRVLADRKLTNAECDGMAPELDRIRKMQDTARKNADIDVLISKANAPK